MKSPKTVLFGVVVFVALIFILALSASTFVTIQAGQTGILFRKFGDGLDKENPYGQGFHIIAPWNTMFVYDTRLTERSETMEVLAKNGLEIEIDLSVRYRPDPMKVGYLHDAIGPDFANKIVVPEIRSSTRKVIGKYLPEELYSTKRETIQTEILESTRTELNRKDIMLDAVLIRSVLLPSQIKDAIEAKLVQEQQSQQYEFRIVQARKEADRLKIEAQGKADANKILNASLSANILTEKGINATEQLANSPNTKVVIVGNSKNGLPLILGN